MTRRRSLVGIAALGLVTASIALAATPAAATRVPASAAHRTARPGPNPRGKFLGVVPSPAASESRAFGAASAHRSVLSNPLIYHNGRIQHSSAVYAIFWKPAAYAFPSGYQATVARFFGDVAHDSFKTTNVLATDTQYYEVVSAQRFVSYSVRFKGAILDTRPYPAAGCQQYQLNDGSQSKTCLTDAQVEHEISTLVTSQKLPRGLGAEYFVFTPPGVASCFTSAATDLAAGNCYDPTVFNGYCAYHASIGGGPAAVLYANMPYANLAGCSSGESPNGNAADAVINTASHEHNETMTDPLGTAWYDTAGNENGDKCLFTFGTPLGSTATGQYNQVINGHHYWLQEEWSNRIGGCAQRSSFPLPTASITHSPASVQHGVPVTFGANAADKDDTAFTYSWSFGNGAASSRAHPTVTFPSAGTATVSVIVFDAHGDQTRVTRSIQVS